jgi:2-keto-4-pentenoate hydratase/2-oxohepta-3-ene-1,7-dioic acid hydratase in catechol pathway
MKATSSICGPNDNIEIPPECQKVDWEAELGIIVGSTAKRVQESEALNYVAGYCLVDDVSERDFQSHRAGQWVKGKSLDTFGPIGPWLVTTDELPEPDHLNIWQEVDGKRYQDGNTSQMIFKVPYLISYLSHFMTLHPGDIIATGTPAGVGLGQKPEPVYLQAGQTLRLGVDGLGEQCHLAVKME